MLTQNPSLKWVGVALVLAIAAFAVSVWVSPSDEPDALLAYERNTVEIFQRASPSVVFVHNLQNRLNAWTWDVTEVQQGTGSGFLWDRSGHIVTNYHVVHQASRVAVTLIDGKTYEARVVGGEVEKDLAVLKIDLVETNVQPLGERLADSARVMVGQKAIAIGNPFGLDHTLTVGSISAVGRSRSSIVEGVIIRDMLQTDAAINPGNSGGPLLDSNGRLLGMNTLIQRNSTGIGFAVPSNTIGRIVNQIIQYGKPIRSGIGVQIWDPARANYWVRRIGVQGVVLREVLPDSPASRAGLRGTSLDAAGRFVLGDIILSIDGQATRDAADMYNIFDIKAPGQEIDLTYFREGEVRSVRVVVDTMTE